MEDNAVGWAFLSAGIALLAVLLVGVALIVYQRRFLAMHRDFADGLVRAQEEERAWVAREVHDDALQRITLLLQELDNWKAEERGAAFDASARIMGLREELEDLSAILRRLAYRLHPSFVETKGLGIALERLAADVSRTTSVRVVVSDEVSEAVSIPGDQALAVYRIAQEAVNNLVKHSRSPAARIAVRSLNGSVELRVEDDGCGFDPEEARHNGLGLTSMMERARGAGGALSVQSRPGAGTMIRLVLPLAGSHA